MTHTRRDFGKFAAAALLAAFLGVSGAALASPNSKIAGVQIGTITYSFKQDVKNPVKSFPTW